MAIMARESTITYEQVGAAANSIKAAGTKPTTRNVRDALGTGSMATVLKFLQQWQASQERQSQAINDTLDPAIARAISDHIAARVQESTAEATARLADLQAETDALIAENERQSSEIEALTADLGEIQGQLATTTGRTQQLEAHAAKQTTELVGERVAAETARVELAKAELRLEAVPKIEAEIEKVRAELLQIRNQAAEMHEAAAVATAKLEAETSRCKIIETQLSETVKQREDAMKRATESAEQLSDAKVSVQVSLSRLDAAEQTISRLQEQLTSSPP